MFILASLIFTNTTYANNCILGTQESRIKEVKNIFTDDKNLENLMKNRQSNESTNEVSRNFKGTSRNGYANRSVKVEVIEEVKIEPVYNKIEDIKISRDMDLTQRTGISREDFIKITQNMSQDTSGFFKDNAGLIYDLCEKYEINEIFFCGLISAESGWNIAQNHRKTHNYISLMVKGKLLSYSSVEEGLEVAANKLHTNYLTVGGKFYHGKTIYGVQKCFCPSDTWVNLVYGRMQQVMKAVEKSI